MQIRNGELASNEVEYSIPPKSHENRFKVIATGIQLFSDKETKTPIEVKGVSGVKLMVYEHGRHHPRISPTRTKYNVGEYISHEFTMSEVCGESWYKDPLDHGTVKYGWTSSALFNGKVIGKEKVFKPISLSIRPEKIVSGVNETRLLRAVAIESDGILNIEKDVSTQAEWHSEDKDIAHIDKNGLLRLKALGLTEIQCKYAGLHDNINVEVITPTTGMKVKYFSSDLKRYQQIRFDNENNLYITNQSSSVYKLGADGSFSELLRLPCFEHPKYGLSENPPSIDRLAIGLKGDIYINCASPRSVHRFSKGKLEEVISSSHPLKGVAVDSKGTVYIGNMNNLIMKIETGKNPEVFGIRIHSIDLKLIDDDRIVVGSAGGGDMITVYSTDGDLLHSISSPLIKSPTDFAVKDGEVFVASFDSGEIYKLDLSGHSHIKIADGFDSIGGIDFDSEGNLYVSIFSAEDSNNICIYKVYL